MSENTTSIAKKRLSRGKYYGLIEALNAILRQGAQPWWNFYGGKDHLDIVDSFSLKRSLKSESGQ